MKNKQTQKQASTWMAAALAGLLGTATSVNAATLVNWGGNEYINNSANTTGLTSINMQGDITSGSQVFTGLGDEDPSNYHQRNGLDETFIPPNSGVNAYNPDAHQSGVFYGAFENVRTDSTTNLSSAGAPQVRNAISAGGVSGQDSILFNRQLGASPGTANTESNLSQNTAMILWRDWVNAGTYTYGDLTNFSVNMTQVIGANTRMLVETEDGYYLNSTENLFTNSNGLKEFDADALAALRFTAYDVSSQFFTATAGLDGMVDLSAETIIGIGLWNTQSTNGNQNWGFDSIQVTAIPEPGTLALLGMAGLACILTLKRRKA